jgi:hypothetical protein
MSKSKIFIASSTRSLVLAENLKKELATDYSAAEVWTEASRAANSQTIIEMLESSCEEYDFAVILLTQDDQKVSDGVEKLKARDNCIFEAGLFMAAVGRKRCFLVSSVNPGDLPTDLSGLILIPFVEPADPQKHQECQDAIFPASMQIKSRVQDVGPVENRRLSRGVLLQREKKRSEGGDLYEDQVVVASIQPLEVTYAAARQIRKNVDGNIRYVYFIPASDECAEKICLLLQLVLLAGVFGTESDADSYQKRRQMVQQDPAGIFQKLERLCRDGSIQVFFLAVTPEMQYCIHNATDETNARQYVKHRDEFIEWASGKEAHQFWVDVKQRKPEVSDPKPPYALFHGLAGVEVRDGAFFRSLQREIGRYFPGIEERVLDLCLKGPAPASN